MVRFLVMVALVGACKMNDKPANKQPAPPPVVTAAHSPYCAGATAWPSDERTCSDDRECGANQRCYADGLPDMSQMCGARPADQIGCTGDSSCKHGQFCKESRGFCGSQVTKCVDGCPKQPCGADMRCGKDARCVAIACSDGYTCPAGSRCGARYSDEHGCGHDGCWEGGPGCGSDEVCVPKSGCALRACKRASDCACGACVDGTCHARPGVCGPAQLHLPG